MRVLLWNCEILYMFKSIKKAIWKVWALIQSTTIYLKHESAKQFVLQIYLGSINNL